VLGIGSDDDGMPLAENGLPPATLGGRPPAFYEDLLRRARAHTHARVARFTDDDLAREMRSSPPQNPGNERVFDARWILYHVLEHLAGHHGQILMLRHQYRAAVRTPAPSA
jgi:hypothetical protein